MATVANLDGGNVAGAVRVTDPSYVKHNREHAGDPQGALTPQYAGELVLDITNGALYQAQDLTSDSWIEAMRVV